MATKRPSLYAEAEAVGVAAVKLAAARFSSVVASYPAESLCRGSLKVRITLIAVVARPVRGHLLPEMLEDVPGSALGGLTELDHRAELLLIHRPALLVILEVGAQIDGAEVVAESLPLSATVLTDESVAL